MPRKGFRLPQDRGSGRKWGGNQAYWEIIASGGHSGQKGQSGWDDSDQAKKYLSGETLEAMKAAMRAQSNSLEKQGTASEGEQAFSERSEEKAISNIYIQFLYSVNRLGIPSIMAAPQNGRKSSVTISLGTHMVWSSTPHFTSLHNP